MITRAFCEMLFHFVCDTVKIPNQIVISRIVLYIQTK